jgi:hypothetical protein
MIRSRASGGRGVARLSHVGPATRLEVHRAITGMTPIDRTRTVDSPLIIDPDRAKIMELAADERRPTDPNKAMPPR